MRSRVEPATDAILAAIRYAGGPSAFDHINSL